MELNKEQITLIDNYLKDKGVKYWDIRLEMIDHIVNDIEYKINNENICFKDAFNSSIEIWKSHLGQKSSWMTGLANSKPKIVLQKTTKIFSKWLVLYLFLGLLPLVFNKTSFSFRAIDYQFIIKTVILSFLIISNTLIIFWFLKIDKTKIKSTYRFLFVSQVLSVLLLTPFLLIEFLYQGGVLNLELWMVSFIGLELVATVFGYKMFKKHQEIFDKFRLLP